MSNVQIPLKHLALLNPETLGEDTPPDHFFRYIDIATTGRGVLLDGPAPMTFETSPSRARRILRPGDTILSTVRTYLRAGWTLRGTDDDLVASTGFVCLRPRAHVDPRFLGWLAQADVVVEEVVAKSVGVSYPAINPSDVGRIKVSCPPLPDQRAIADYLDRETARIDALIAAKRRMVELLEERRTSLRDHAFASRSGWRLKRLLARPMAYGVLVPEFVEAGTGVPMIRTYNLSTSGRISHEDIAEIPRHLAQEYRRTSLRQGDVVLSVVGSMGRSAVVDADEHGFNLNRPLARLQFRPEMPPRLIWHWTQTTHFMDMAKLATGGGTAQPTLNLGDLANFTIGLPQATERWSAILSNLEEVCGRLDDIEQSVSRQIVLLQERRKALITAAVTGQLDIREAA